jgi:type II secretory pathway pseudopilin PulG
MNRTPPSDRANVAPTGSRREGFALVEVAVLVVILGLAAQIMIPRLLGHRGAATDTPAETLLRNAARDVEIAYSSTRDYGSITTAQLDAIDPAITFQATPASAADHQVQVTVDPNGYSLDATGKNGSTFDYTRLGAHTPQVTRTLTAPGGASASW